MGVMQERTKKVILMLQKSFKHKEKSAPLRFQQMIHPAEGAPPPTKHTVRDCFDPDMHLGLMGESVVVAVFSLLNV